MRARGAVLTFLPLVLAASAAATNAPTNPGYPRGVCDPRCALDPPPCPGRLCAASRGCPRYLAPTTDPDSDARPWTYCQPDFDAPCTDARLGCPRCVLRLIATRKCTPAERCEPRPSKGYAVMRSREEDPRSPGRGCFTRDHFMLVPTRPCTGIESPDPLCAGAQGEKYWGYAFDEARARGFGVPGGAHPAKWGILLNPKNGRSQHQAHFRFAPLKLANGTGRASNIVVDRFAALAFHSTFPSRPTFTWGQRSALIASAFVTLPSQTGSALASVARPLALAATIARAAMPLTMYGVLVIPQRQGNASGVVVGAFFNARGSVLLDETVADYSNGNCAGACDVWGTRGGAVAPQRSGGPPAADPKSDSVLFGLHE
ncbi:hypothetical protein DFJ74DRAFT_694387 [Hyaloraphidium curvatum]|nr:hypothetical protein DFJ74DRAFT_694387 [Hyaloraphidium curvatum]